MNISSRRLRGFSLMVIVAADRVLTPADYADKR